MIINFPDIFYGQVLDTGERVQAGGPEYLIGIDIAYSGNEGRVHQDLLKPSFLFSEQLFKIPEIYLKRFRAKTAYFFQILDLVVVHQNNLTETPRVRKPKLITVIKVEDKADVSVLPVFFERAGHCAYRNTLGYLPFPVKKVAGDVL